MFLGRVFENSFAWTSLGVSSLPRRSLRKSHLDGYVLTAVACFVTSMANSGWRKIFATPSSSQAQGQRAIHRGEWIEIRIPVIVRMSGQVVVAQINRAIRIECNSPTGAVEI